MLALLVRVLRWLFDPPPPPVATWPRKCPPYTHMHGNVLHIHHDQPGPPPPPVMRP